MAAVTLTGKGSFSITGRVAGFKSTLPLTGKGTIASGGRINTGVLSYLLTANAITISDRLAASATTTLTNSLNREWREELSEAGFGSVSLMNDNTLNTSLDWLPNLLVNFYVGSTLAYTILVEQYESVDVAEQEEAAQKTVYKGRGHVALCDRILIYPALGPYQRPIEEDRAFNWTNPAYDDTAWTPAHDVATILFAKVGWDSGVAEVQWDSDFPDDTAEVLWATDGTILDGGIGDCYFRQTITVGTTGTYSLYAGADNYGEVYVDGVLMLSPGQASDLEVGFTRMSKITIELTAGTHYIACKCTNGTGTGSNPAGIAWALYPADALGNIGALAAHSSAVDTVMVEYATEPPGMTPGQAIILCLDEALAREADPLWQKIRDNLSFTEARDSNGDYWPVFADMATKIGTGLYTLLRELAGTYIEFSMSPGGFILNAWAIGNRTTGGTATFLAPSNPLDQTTGNLLHLSRKGEA